MFFAIIKAIEVINETNKVIFGGLFIRVNWYPKKKAPHISKNGRIVWIPFFPKKNSNLIDKYIAIENIKGSKVSMVQYNFIFSHRFLLGWLYIFEIMLS